MLSAVPRPAAAELLKDFARGMRRRRWRWYVYGAQAVLAYGRPRMTADVDVTVRLRSAGQQELLEELPSVGFALRFDVSEAFLKDARLLPMVHVRTAMPIDVVIASSRIEDGFISRSRRVNVGGIAVPMISPEDLIATKVLAGRRKDLEDARGVLLERWGSFDAARTRRVLETLDRALGGNKLQRRFQRLVRGVSRTQRPR